VVSVIDDEGHIWQARCAEAPDGWPFDADRDDPLTAHRIAVTSSLPGWFYLVAFDRESVDRPTDAEVALLVSFLNEYKDHWYGDNSYRRRMEARPLDVDGGANGIAFHKWGADDWGYRRRSYLPACLLDPSWFRDNGCYQASLPGVRRPEHGSAVPPAGVRFLVIRQSREWWVVDEVIRAQLAPSHPLARALDEFLTDLGNGNASPHTICAYRGDLLAFAAHHEGGPGAVTAAPVRAYLAETANLSPATRKRKRAALASFCRWAYREPPRQRRPAAARPGRQPRHRRAGRPGRERLRPRAHARPPRQLPRQTCRQGGVTGVAGPGQSAPSRVR
jgi:hypothetical protein